MIWAGCPTSSPPHWAARTILTRSSWSAFQVSVLCWLSSPLGTNQLDSLFFCLHEQLLSKLLLIHFDRHRSEGFGHHQGTVNLSNPRAIFAGPRP